MFIKFRFDVIEYTKVKIQLFKDITMFDYTDSSILGGLYIASQNIVNNDDNKSTISSCDVCSFFLLKQNY